MIRFSSRLVTRASAVVHARRCVASKAGKCEFVTIAVFSMLKIYLFFVSFACLWFVLVKPGYVSTAPVEYTQKLKFFGEPTEVIPAYQVMDLKGKVIDAKQEPNVKLVFSFFKKKNKNKPTNLQLNEETLMKMYKTMVELHNTDQVLYDLQRY